MNEINFLFVLYFIGFIFASWMDFKRREIDDWLTLGLFFSGTFYLIFETFFSGNYFSLSYFGFFILTFLIISLFLYNIRFFSGGDAKLLFSTMPFFYSLNFVNAFTNFGKFLLVFLFTGAVYGLIYILFIYFKNFKKINKEVREHYGKNLLVKILVSISLILFILSYFQIFFMFFSFILLFSIFLLIIGKSLEKSIFTFYKNSRDLVPGDRLASKIKIDKKNFKNSWEGLSEEEIKILRKNKKKVLIVEGIPYAFVFLLSLLVYFFI